MQTILKNNLTNDSRSELEIYVHIPFCVKKCDYCDFLSAPADEESRFVYVKALENEIVAKSRLLDAKNKYLVTSIFLGGGTPTVLSGETLSEILCCIKNNYCVDDNAEITFECNPGTVDYDKLALCKKAGYNRISIGLQSALDEELELLGRIHSYEDFLNAYYSAVKCGFDNINVDLISALPKQTMENIEITLNRILELNPRPTHISSYSLILEEGTVFKELYDEHILEFPDEETERKMHWYINDRLEAEGYREYELSNLAMPGYECRHNVGYWTRREYLGIGIGAASLLDEVRKTNTHDINEYLDFYGKGAEIEAWEEEPLYECEIVQKHEQMEEFMFLGLRMNQGISAREFEKRFGRPLHLAYGGVIAENVSDNLLETDGDLVRLTRRGQDFANYVFYQFIL